MAEESIVITKYANRRLYNPITSQYITLEDLCDMVKEGIDFTVVDEKSGEDLTRFTLAQIIFEQESKDYNLFSIDFLRQIISFYGSAPPAVFLPNYLETTMENFSHNQDEMHDYIQAFEGYIPVKQIEEMGRINVALLEQTMKMFKILKGKI